MCCTSSAAGADRNQAGAARHVLQICPGVALGFGRDSGQVDIVGQFLVAAMALGMPELDPYAAESPAEFFAVSSEAFFIDPQPLQAALPDWYGLLRQYYRQDPAQRLA